MNKVILFVLIGIIPNMLLASTKDFNKDMEPVLKAYLEIPKILATDSTKGVIDAAKKIETLTWSEKVPGQNHIL